MRQDKLKQLLLCRLSLKSGKARSATAVSSSLYKYFALHVTRRDWDAAFAKALKAVRTAKHVEADRTELTGAGRREVERLLGAAPRSNTWSEFERRELLTLLGRTAGVDVVSSLMAKALGCDAASNASRTVDDWLVRELGLTQGSLTLDGLRAALLARKLGVPVRPKLRDVVALGAAELAGAPSGKPEHVLAALVARHTGAAPKQRSSPSKARRVASSSNGAARRGTTRRREPPSFASRVLTAARSPETRRFGASKAFIRSVWEQVHRDPDMAKLGWSGFVEGLLAAHRQGDLVLSRADLVAAMDPDDVRSSEIAHLGATYHFVNVERAAS